MIVPLLAIGTAPLALDALIEAVTDRGTATGSDGAVATFLGLVRNHNVGRVVQHLEYEGYEAAGPAGLRANCRGNGRSAGRACGWRCTTGIGRIEIGDASVAIAAASAHRAHAFSACRYAIERVKQIAPIWKREFFEGGDVWIEGATADPDDEKARQEAERVACV